MSVHNYSHDAMNQDISYSQTMFETAEWSAGEVERVVARRCVGRGRVVVPDTLPVVCHVEDFPQPTTIKVPPKHNLHLNQKFDKALGFRTTNSYTVVGRGKSSTWQTTGKVSGTTTRPRPTQFRAMISNCLVREEERPSLRQLHVHHLLNYHSGSFLLI